MKPAAAVVVACGLLFVGCHTAKEVGVTTFRVLDAPANYIRHHIEGEPTTTTTTTTTTSDVTNPGQPVQVTAPPPRRTTSQSRNVTSQSPAGTTTASPRRSTSPAPHTPSQQPQSFPTAKAVPGKPGFVISPYDPNGGYVDVTGYPSGSKAKDPYSQKIFVVP
jgi:hypothetical protein